MIPFGSSIHAYAVALAAGWSPRHGEHSRDTLARSMGITGDLHYRLHVDAPKHGRIVVCPHASATHKEWPESRWSDLLAKLPGVIVCPAPGRDFLGQAHPDMALPELTRTLAGASLVITVDSGPIHLADALGVPVIGLYAATSATTYGPYNDASRCIDKHREASDALGLEYDSARHLGAQAMELISVDGVMQEIGRG